MKKKKTVYLMSILILVSIIYTVLVKIIDVQAIGPMNSKVGFATINNFVRQRIGYSDLAYKISKYLGLISFLIVAFYGFIGLIQLLKKKKLFKVDKRILLLGCFYVLVGLVYVFFEIVVINYRPILEDGLLEASYPSSHTMLALTICLSSLLISKYYVKDLKLKVFNIVTIMLMILLVVTRTLSGVHWLSDIIGGIIISISLVMIYYTSLKFYDKK